MFHIQINPTQYVFHEDTETCTPVYTTYYEDYNIFYKSASEDIVKAKKSSEYGLDMEHHPDGYLFFVPIINWGK